MEPRFMAQSRVWLIRLRLMSKISSDSGGLRTDVGVLGLTRSEKPGAGWHPSLMVFLPVGI